MVRITISETGQQSRSYTFDTTDILIGRDPSSDICLMDESVSRRHCRIEQRNGVWRVGDLGAPNGVFLRHRHKNTVERVIVEDLTDGDLIQIDRYTLLFELCDAQGEVVSRRMRLPDTNPFDRTPKGAETQVIRMHEVRQKLEVQPISLTAFNMAAVTPDGPAPPQQRLQLDAIRTDPQGTLPRVASPSPGLASPVAGSAAAEPDAPTPGLDLALIPGEFVEGGLRTRDDEIIGPASAQPHLSHPSLPARAAQFDFLVRLRNQSSGRDEIINVVGEAAVGTGSGCVVPLEISTRDRVIGVLRRDGDLVRFQRTTRWPFPRTLVDGRAITRAAFRDGARLFIGGVQLDIVMAR